MVFDISGVYALENTSEVNYAKSLLEEFEDEFKRSLSPSEMDRILIWHQFIVNEWLSWL